MLTPVYDIQIGNYNFKTCHALEVIRDIEKMSTTGFISMPKKLAIKTDDGFKNCDTNKLIKRSDKVIIKAGYKETKTHNIFSGFINEVNTRKQVRFDIEDSMFLLRNKPVVISGKDLMLKDILNKAIEGITLANGKNLKLSSASNNMKFDLFNYKGSAFGLCNKIRQLTMLSLYIDDKSELYCGLQQTNKRDSVKLIYGENIIKNNVSFRTKESHPLQVKVIGKKTDNTEISKIVGESGGDVITLRRLNISDEAKLEQIAKEYHKRNSYTGFKGDLTFFFHPFAQLGGSVNYLNKNYTLPEGEYFIKKIKYKSGRGLKQIVTLGEKLS
jgi:hypothetical protein